MKTTDALYHRRLIEERIELSKFGNFACPDGSGWVLLVKQKDREIKNIGVFYVRLNKESYAISKLVVKNVLD